MITGGASSLGTDAADLPLPGDLLREVRESRAVAQAAEARILVLAVEWAHAHPADPDQAGDRSWQPVRGIQPWVETDPAHVFAGDDPELVLDYGIPPVAWDAPAAFAAANGMSTTAGRALLRDALVLVHRLPLTYRQVVTGGCCRCGVPDGSPRACSVRRSTCVTTSTPPCIRSRPLWGR